MRKAADVPDDIFGFHRYLAIVLRLAFSVNFHWGPFYFNIVVFFVRLFVPSLAFKKQDLDQLCIQNVQHLAIV